MVELHRRRKRRYPYKLIANLLEQAFAHGHCRWCLSPSWPVVVRMVRNNFNLLQKLTEPIGPAARRDTGLYLYLQAFPSVWE